VSTFGAQVEPKDAPREPKEPKRSPKASPEASAKHAKVAFRPEAVIYPRTCVQGVPPRTKQGAFLMDFGSFLKAFWLFFSDVLATQNECSRIRLPCNATQRNAMQCTATQCTAMQCSATQCHAMQRNATHCNATQRNPMQRNATQCNAILSHNTGGLRRATL